ncbi:MAG TPA: YidC/Oxa1 family insertase periplasmic-domain containing protein [Gemmatimonadaceae bacterium]|nr:YidC/Oxa1 family insertase periplasmic-domain containing protein [Gemmatimonadaceae bacterium]
MDRRMLLAIVLVLAVIFLTPLLFPPPPVAPPDTAVTTTPAESAVQRAEPALGATPPAAPAPTEAPSASVESVWVADTLARFRFLNIGAVLDEVELRSYRALGKREGNVVLRAGSAPLLRFEVLADGDTLGFHRTPFHLVRRDNSGKTTLLSYVGAVGGDTLSLDFGVVADSYMVHVDGRLSGARVSTARTLFLLAEFAPTLESHEADTLDDQRHLAFAVEPDKRDARAIGFGSLEPGEREVVPGPHKWVALKSKYFIVGLLSRPEGSPIAEFSVQGLPRLGRLATQARGVAVVQPERGRFALDVYAGPQQWRRLQAVGRDFVNSNPYGGFLQPIVQPFAVLVMRILLWMHEVLRLGYGWVLVVFGVAVRLVLWPLNQRAMRTSIKMQRIQPELAELQKRYKNDPQKLQAEMMRLYKEHGMSPFSMFSGCLPLLLPMPVLIALFFVFQSTIEFRGVSFLWLADISQKDPYYILPILMGASMYVLSWIGSRNTPPNPQTKVMMYVFPAMMTFLLANLASGLNLYYTVQNLAALPQQWLIANERARAARDKK